MTITASITKFKVLNWGKQLSVTYEWRLLVMTLDCGQVAKSQGRTDSHKRPFGPLLEKQYGCHLERKDEHCCGWWKSRTSAAVEPASRVHLWL